MRRFLPLLFLIACAEPASPPVTPAPRPGPGPPGGISRAPASAAPASPPPAYTRSAAQESSCKAIEASSRRALDRALSASEELQGDPVPDLSATPRGCIDRSPWAIDIETAAPFPCKGGSCATLRWRVAHVTPSGEIARGPVLQDLVGAHALRILRVVTHDWDGDGEPELLLRRSRAVTACGREAEIAEERGDLWNFHNNTVEPYRPAQGVLGETGPQSAGDEDGDGVPDLRTEGVFRAMVELPCGTPGGAALLAGPAWLARGQKGGGFSLSDGLAEPFHRKECPAPPAALVQPSPKVAFALAVTARNVACARAWGVSGERLREDLEAGRSQLCPGAVGACAALEELKRWTTLPAPVRLH